MLSASKKSFSAALLPLRRTGKYIKTALGAEDAVEWEYVKDTVEAVDRLKKGRLPGSFAIEQAENTTPLENFSLSPDQKYALIFGNEVKGVQQEVIDLSDGCIEIPQFGTKHSLNISVTVGIVLWQIISPLLGTLQTD